MAKAQTLWMVRHKHRHGVDIHHFTSSIQFESDLPGDAELAEALGMDLEPDEGETLEIQSVRFDSIIDLDQRMTSETLKTTD